jgi:hypothetical protein
MEKAPWLKLIDSVSGHCTSLALEESPFATAIISDANGVWTHSTEAGTERLTHGSIISGVTSLYVFMAHVQFRSAEFESRLLVDPHAKDLYSDWLEEKGDPFASVLNPKLFQGDAPVASWYLEGLERLGSLSCEFAHGLLHKISIGVVPATQVMSILHRVCSLRAAVTLEELAIDGRSFEFRNILHWRSALLGWTMWNDFRWPKSLKKIVLIATKSQTPLPTADELTQFRARLTHATPRLRVEFRVQ